MRKLKLKLIESEKRRLSKRKKPNWKLIEEERRKRKLKQDVRMRRKPKDSASISPKCVGNWNLPERQKLLRGGRIQSLVLNNLATSTSLRTLISLQTQIH